MSVTKTAALAVALVVVAATTSLVWFNQQPRLSSWLQRSKSRLITKFVNSKLKLLFEQKGGRVELGQFQHHSPTTGQATHTSTHFKNAPSNLADFYLVAKDYAQDDHLVYYPEGDKPPTRETYAQVLGRAESLSASLQSKDFNVQQGDRVAVLMSNLPEFGVSFMAITRIGAIAVLLNAFWEGLEIDYGLRHSQTSVLVCDDRRLGRLLQQGDGSLFAGLVRDLDIKVLVVNAGAHYAAAHSAFPAHVLLFEDYCVAGTAPTYTATTTVSIPPETPCVLMYTAGTTSPQPKGVLHTHIAVINTVMCYALFAELVKSMRGEKDKTTLRRSDLVTGPMFHAGSLYPVFLLSFCYGHKLVMMPKWDTQRALEICIQEKITFFGSMAAVLSDIVQSPFFLANKHRFSFTNIGTGGSTTPSELIRRISRALPNVTQGSGWGLTESAAIGTIIGGPDYVRLPGSCGRPHPIIQLKLVDPDTLEDTTREGELVIQSITNMTGYWRNEQATREALLPGNWLRTGDYARVDEDGFVFIIDRVKEIVIRGGENISTAEVESEIYSYSAEAVADVVCFGLPHERLGEQLCAVIVPTNTAAGRELHGSKIKLHLAGKLAKFKVPAVCVVRAWNEPLPRSGANKVLKRVLREEYKSVEENDKPVQQQM